MIDSPNDVTSNGHSSNPTDRASQNGNVNGEGAQLVNNRLNEIDARTNHTFNEQVEILTLNWLEQRNNLMSRYLDPRRDISAECGYPRGYIPPETYQELFERDHIAARVVELMPKECFQISPDIYENEDPDVETKFEKRIKQICSKLVSCYSGTSSYSKDDKKSKLIDLMKRADIHSRIGSYGVMVIGINDGVDLSQPAEMREPEEEDEDKGDDKVDTLEEDGGKGNKVLDTRPSVDQQIPNPFSTSTPDTRPFLTQWGTIEQGDGISDDENGKLESPYTVDKGLGLIDRTNKMKDKGAKDQTDTNDNDPSQDPSQGNTLKLSPRNGKGKGKKSGKNGKDYWLDLNFIQVFSEYYCQISEWDNDERSPRFGQPVMYQITFNDTRQIGSGGSSSQPIITRDVHWTRVVHIAEDTNSIRAFPVMQQVLNRLLDLQKVYGPDAESFYINGIPGWAFQTHPELGDVRLNKAGLKNEWENFRNSILGKLVTSQGGEFKPLTTSMTDPTSHILIHIQAICMKLGCPQRIFMGSERGELASSQDDAAWNDRVRERQNNYIKPCIIERLIDRLIALGVLPVPEAEEGYKVWWPDLESQGQQEKATIAGAKTTAMATFFDPTKEIFTRMAPMDFWTKIMGMDDKEAQEVIENAEKEREKVKKEKEEEAAKQVELQDEQARTGMERDLEFQQKQAEAMALPPEQQAASSEQAGVVAEEATPEAELEELGITENLAQLVSNIFCKTGAGGGINPSCAGSSSGLSGAQRQAKTEAYVAKTTKVLQESYGVTTGAAHNPVVHAEAMKLQDHILKSPVATVIKNGVDRVLASVTNQNLKGDEKKEGLKQSLKQLRSEIGSAIFKQLMQNSSHISDHPQVDKIAGRVSKIPDKMAESLTNHVKEGIVNTVKGFGYSSKDPSSVAQLKERTSITTETYVRAYTSATTVVGLHISNTSGKVKHDVLDAVDQAILGVKRSKELRYVHSDDPSFIMGTGANKPDALGTFNIPLTNNELTENIFCKTGAGGGIDPTCGGAGSGLSGDAANTYLAESQAKWRENLGIDEERSLRRYSSNTYHELSPYLRGGITPDVLQESSLTGEKLLSKEKLDGIIKTLDQAISNSSIDKQIDLTRRISTEYISHLKEGDVYTDAGFGSFTTNPFNPNTHSSNSVLLVSLPAGSKGAYLEPWSRHDFNRGEHEVLFPRNMSYKVSKIDGQKIYIEIIQQVQNVFCKTGPGGGIKPDCFSHSDVGGGSTPIKQLATEKQIYEMKPKALKALAAEIGYEVYQKSSGALKARLVSILDSGRLVKDGMKDRGTNLPKTSVETPKPLTPSISPTEHPAAILRSSTQSVLGAFKGLDKGYNQVSLTDLAKQTGLPLADLHRAVNDLRKKGVITLSQVESGLTPAGKAALDSAIKEDGQYLGYVSIRNEEAAQEIVENSTDQGLSYAELTTENVFCKTGVGGGINPSCGGNSDSGGATLADGTVISFKKHSGSGPEEVMVMLDPAKVDKAIAVYDRIDSAGQGQVAIAGRREKFSEFLKTGEQIEASTMSHYKDGSIRIADGRHRFSVLRDRGATSIGATVHKADAAEFIRKYGTTESQTELAAKESKPKTESSVSTQKKGFIKRILGLNEEQETGMIDNIFCPTGPGGGIKPDCGSKSAIGLELKNSPHTGTTEKVAAFQNQQDTLQSQRTTLGSKIEQVYNEERQARNSGNKEEANRLSNQGKDIDSQLQILKSRQQTLKEEAHEIIKTELAIVSNSKSVSSNLNNPIGPTSSSFNDDISKAKQFLDGMVHNANIPPSSTAYATGNNRPGYEPVGKSITASTMDTTTAVVHEYGHHLEYNVPGVQKAAQEFLKYRTAGEPLTNMREKFPEGRYRPEETGRKDNFDKSFEGRSAYYVGKQYKDGSTEVIAMGLEKIHSDPIKFAKADPEYFTFMLGVLSGKHRDGEETGYDRAKTYTQNSSLGSSLIGVPGHILLDVGNGGREFFEGLLKTLDKLNQQGKEPQETTVNVFNTVPTPAHIVNTQAKQDTENEEDMRTIVVQPVINITMPNPVANAQPIPYQQPHQQLFNITATEMTIQQGEGAVNNLIPVIKMPEINVDVHVPEQPAPIVNLTNEITVPAPEVKVINKNVIEVQPAEVTVIKQEIRDESKKDEAKTKIVKIERTAEGEYKGTVEEQ